MICMSIRFDQLSKAFSNQCVSDQNPRRNSVNQRPKRNEMYAFSNENALVWTGPGARFSKVPVTLRARNQIFKSKYKE